MDNSLALYVPLWAIFPKMGVIKLGKWYVYVK